MPITFEPLTAADVPRFTGWLQQPHVRAFWDDGERDEAAVTGQYLGPDRDDVPGFIFSVDGRPAGFLQTEWIQDGHEFQPWAAPGGETWAIDLLIGEAELIGHGVGPRVITAFIGTLQRERPALRRMVIDPDERNARAIRAYGKVGFEPAGILEGDGERRVIMTLNVGWRG
ncbi:aminoglycoside 6'-N-acetyltransferase [Deinococcus metalli]|uniref:Aminoglycoside 6'-N-acetyltransferase n=1 Tax=Deinococcus metalli TaxID=1141878 RepID=A0A7W8NRH8_9DEIO|nr:GNAT family N-acetyltransferase [Deinococcus metalli]MBB5376908.1 aminoglycoside 6'-N-acetyltransferase [Deinococcus metalli]GHF46240.1 GNAT family N-acetyltransferase [Deinococcus metalli]